MMLGKSSKLMNTGDKVADCDGSSSVSVVFCGIVELRLKTESPTLQLVYVTNMAIAYEAGADRMRWVMELSVYYQHHNTNLP